MEISMIDEYSGLRELSGEWNNMLLKSETNSIFLTFEWISNWWECFGEGKTLKVILGKENGVLMGIAPLMVTKRKLEFIGASLSDYADFIVGDRKEEFLNEVYKYILENRDFSIMNLAEIPEGSSTLELSHKIFNELGLFQAKHITEMCPSAVFASFEENELKKRLNKRDLRRRFNELSKGGRVELNYVEDIESIDKLLPTFFEFHMRRWDAANQPSMFHDEKHKEFFRKLFVKMKHKGWINLLVMRFKGEAIAFNLTFPYANKITAYTPTYNPDYVKYSPSLIVLKHDIQNTFNSGMTEFDLSRGDEPYKFRFTNTLRKNFELIVTKNVFLHYYYLFYKSAKNYVRRKILKKG